MIDDLPLMDRGATESERDALRQLFRSRHKRGGSGNGGEGCEHAICDFYRTQHHGLSKSYFDLFVNLAQDRFRGVSVKKKGLPSEAALMHTFWGAGTAVMELSNISTWWKDGLMEPFKRSDYDSGRHAARMGAKVLENMRLLRDESPNNLKSRQYAEKTGRTLDVGASRFINILWNHETPDVLILTYDMSLPDSLRWTYEGESLVGRRGKQVVVRWYGSGRGHLAYTPPAREALFRVRL